MMYPKNVPMIERVLRVALGIAFSGYAIYMLATQTDPSIPVVLILFGNAAFVIVTGFVGWCPACAIVGRKIKQKQSNPS
jgi:hypothetical protein